MYLYTVFESVPVSWNSFTNPPSFCKFVFPFYLRYRCWINCSFYYDTKTCFLFQLTLYSLWVECFRPDFVLVVSIILVFLNFSTWMSARKGYCVPKGILTSVLCGRWYKIIISIPLYESFSKFCIIFSCFKTSWFIWVNLKEFAKHWCVLASVKIEPKGRLQKIK